MKQKKLINRLARAAQRVPEGLRTLQQLRHALEDGRPLHALFALVDELAEQLLRVEDAAGLFTPADLFNQGA